MMIKSNWCAESSLNRDCKLTITDIERRRASRNLIIASENKLAMMAHDRQSNIEEIALETTILKASKQLEDELERFILFFETQ
jgi:hypothetical protein